jgi:hypothetical protein
MEFIRKVPTEFYLDINMSASELKLITLAVDHLHFGEAKDHGFEREQIMAVARELTKIKEKYVG